MSDAPFVAIVGATGAVGREIIKVLSQRRFSLSGLRLLASHRSAGTTVPFEGQTYQVEELDRDSFVGVDIAFFSAGASISREYAPVATASGCLVVDNSSAFRMDPGTAAGCAGSKSPPSGRPFGFDRSAQLFGNPDVRSGLAPPSSGHG